MPVCEIDLRVGGKWRFVNRHPQGEVCCYVSGVPRDQRARTAGVHAEQFPDAVSVVTAELTHEGSKTRLTATVKYRKREVRDIVKGSGMERGAAASYDQREKLARPSAVKKSGLDLAHTARRQEGPPGARQRRASRDPPIREHDASEQ